MEDIMNDLYCVYCYELLESKEKYDNHLEACKKENIIEIHEDAEGDMYFK